MVCLDTMCFECSACGTFPSAAAGLPVQWLTCIALAKIEFRKFVEKTEKELFSLFKSIDKDQNGKLDKEELRAAFKRAGLTVPNAKLDQFFGEIDQNRDVRLPAACFVVFLRDC